MSIFIAVSIVGAIIIFCMLVAVVCEKSFVENLVKSQIDEEFPKWNNGVCEKSGKKWERDDNYRIRDEYMYRDGEGHVEWFPKNLPVYENIDEFITKMRNKDGKR